MRFFRTVVCVTGAVLSFALPAGAQPSNRCAVCGAEAPVTRAAPAGHTFLYDDLQTHLSTAQERVDRLMAAIASGVE